MDVYESCPVFENETYLLRLIREEDAEDLLAVYSDKNALPFFNSDNCHGDNFYYPTLQRMAEAVKFWVESYQNRWFVRLTIIDKSISKAIGTIELFHRDAEDAFDNCGVLRLDVRSDYEGKDALLGILSLVVAPSFDLFCCDEIITKIPIYAVERADAAREFGFAKSEDLMIGANDGYAYRDYWTIHRS